MRRYRYRYTVAQLHRYKNSCRYKYFFLRLATLYIIRRHALQQLRRRRRQRQRQRQGQWQRQQMRHVTHSAFYLCADLFNAAFSFFFYFSQLYSSLFLFCSFAVRRFSRFSRFSVAPVARFIYKFSKKRSTHPPRRGDFPIQFSKLPRVLRQRVRLGALSKENCVENRAPRFSFLKKSIFVRTLGVFWGRERDTERESAIAVRALYALPVNLSLFL